MDSREALDRVLSDVLRPVLEADGGGVDVVSFDGGKLVLQWTGAFRGDPGAVYVQERFLVPLLRKALGTDLVVTWAIGLPAGPA